AATWSDGIEGKLRAASGNAPAEALPVDLTPEPRHQLDSDP
ncbi:MAG: hypothetical protein QOD55_542, partial [Solirubrobacteraceae bacterium]|nr:hypothetical protein [Solirubrobacteraceae bacterium]